MSGCQPTSERILDTWQRHAAWMTAAAAARTARWGWWESESEVKTGRVAIGTWANLFDNRTVPPGNGHLGGDPNERGNCHTFAARFNLGVRGRGNSVWVACENRIVFMYF